MNLKRQGEQTRQKILNAIVSYMMAHGYPPTVREISEKTGLSSTSSIQRQLHRMELDGMITRGLDNEPRTIGVPGIRYVDERGME